MFIKSCLSGEEIGNRLFDHLVNPELSQDCSEESPAPEEDGLMEKGEKDATSSV